MAIKWGSARVVQIISIGILLAAAIVVIRGLMGGTSADFDIDFDGESVQTKGRIPAWLIPDLTRLLKDEMKIGAAHIHGRWSGRVLRIDVSGAPHAGDAQRIRNFLKTELRG